MERSTVFRLAREQSRTRTYLITALVAVGLMALVVRVLCAISMKGYLSDQQYFLTWMQTVDRLGLGQAYVGDGEINYPPLLLLLLGGYKQILDVLGIGPVIGGLSIKLPMIIFDATAMVAVVAFTKRWEPLARVGLFAAFALHPTFILNSAVWGQVDMLHSFLMLTAVVLLPKQPVSGGAVYALACLAKFQAVSIAPVLFALLLRSWWEKKGITSFLRLAIGFIALSGATLVYFAVNGTLGAMFHSGYLSAVGYYPYVTLNAMNIWYYLIGTAPETFDTTPIAPPYLTLRTIGFILLGLAMLAIMAYTMFGRRPVRETLIKAAAMASFAFFMLPTEIHERYCMPALVFVIAAAAMDSGWVRLAMILSLTSFLNMLMPFTGVNPYMGMGLVWLNVYALFGMFATSFKEMTFQRRVGETA